MTPKDLEQMEFKDDPNKVDPAAALAEAKKISVEAMKTMAELKTSLDEERKGRAQDADKLKRLEDASTKSIEEVQKLTAAIADEKRNREAVEAAVSRMNLGAGGDVKGKTDEKTAKAFDSFMRKGQLEEGFKFSGQDNQVELKTLSSNNDPAGGFFLMPDRLDRVVSRVFETSPLRSVATVQTTVNNMVEMIIDDDEAGGGWAAEGGTSGNATTAKIGKLQIPAHKLDSQPIATVEMLADAGFNVEEWHAQKVADKFSRLENTAFFTGNGVGKPRGLLDYAAWGVAGVYERGKVEQVNLGATGALTADGLILQQNALKEPYQPRAVWLMKRASYGACLKLKSTTQYYFLETLLKDGIATPTLLGKPVIFCDDMAAIAANGLSTAYGDFSLGYTILDRLGLTVLRDPFTSKGNVIFYTSKRTGGAVTNYDSYKIGKVAP